MKYGGRYRGSERGREGVRVTFCSLKVRKGVIGGESLKYLIVASF